MDLNLPHDLKIAAAEIMDCYEKLLQQNSNIVHELIKGHEQFFLWQHYPQQDVQDKKTFCQYYYHSHPSPDTDRLQEHGHFHLFIREQGIPKHLKPLYASEKYTENGTDNLCHLLAISMNAAGYPCGFFTVNHWVTQGLWYDAQAIIELLDYFQITESTPSPLVNHWLNAIIKLFKPTLAELLTKRDEIITQWSAQYPDQNVFTAQALEITSLAEFANDN